MKALKTNVLVILSIAILTACSDTALPGEEEARPATAEETTTTASFDAGNYKTTPGKLLRDTDEENVRSIESQVLAEYVPLAFEVDPTLTNGGISTVMYDSGMLLLAFTEETKQVIEGQGYLYGYYNSASAPTDNPDTPSFAVNQAVLRFSNPETALEVTTQLHQAELRQGDRNSGTYFIEGLPQAYISSHVNDLNGAIKYSVFIPHEEYIIYYWTEAPEGEDARQTDFISNAYKLQAPLLAEFPSVKTADGYGKTTDFPSMDPGAVLKYAVQPLEEDPPTFSAYGPRGIAGGFVNPKMAYDTLVQAGSTYNGRGATEVFRGDNDFGAEAISNAFISERVERGFKEYNEPQAIPNTTCVELMTTTGMDYGCTVVLGRYVGAATAKADVTAADQEAQKKKLSQKMAAQYLILTEADQNYGKE